MDASYKDLCEETENKIYDNVSSIEKMIKGWNPQVRCDLYLELTCRILIKMMKHALIENTNLRLWSLQNYHNYEFEKCYETLCMTHEDDTDDVSNTGTRDVQNHGKKKKCRVSLEVRNVQWSIRCFCSDLFRNLNDSRRQRFRSQLF